MHASVPAEATESLEKVGHCCGTEIVTRRHLILTASKEIDLPESDH